MSVLQKLGGVWEKNWPELHAALTGGLPGFIFSNRPAGLDSGVPVFCYHLVEAAAFEEDLLFLKHNGYVTIHADALLDHLLRRKPAPARSVVLTFDDGAQNLYETVLPLLKCYDEQAVAFIAPGLHEGGPEEAAGERAAKACPLSWAQIREMHASGCFDFQSHTYEHRYIPRWPEPVDLEGSTPSLTRPRQGNGNLSVEQDLRRSKERLEQELDKTVRHLAFPKFFGTRDAIRTGRLQGFEAFWWGVLPRLPLNRPGQDPSWIVRVDGRYIRRLPGSGREPLARIFYHRYAQSFQRFHHGSQKLAGPGMTL